MFGRATIKLVDAAFKSTKNGEEAFCWRIVWRPYFEGRGFRLNTHRIQRYSSFRGEEIPIRAGRSSD
jgi:hypothetical protein